MADLVRGKDVVGLRAGEDLSITPGAKERLDAIDPRLIPFIKNEAVKVSYSAVEMMKKIGPVETGVGKQGELVVKIPTSFKDQSGILYGECRSLADRMSVELGNGFPNLKNAVVFGIAPSHFVIEGSSRHYWVEIQGVVIDAALGAVMDYRDSKYERRGYAGQMNLPQYVEVPVWDFDRLLDQPVVAVVNSDRKRTAVIGRSADKEFIYALFYYKAPGGKICPGVKRVTKLGEFELFFQDADQNLKSDQGNLGPRDTNYDEVRQILDLAGRAVSE